MWPDFMFIIGWDLDKELDFEEKLQILHETLDYVKIEC